MQNFCIAYRSILSKNELYATGTTGRLIEEVTNLTIHKHLSGNLGGIQQVAAQISMMPVSQRIGTLAELDRTMILRNLSPGGSADMLALAFLLEKWRRLSDSIFMEGENQ